MKYSSSLLIIIMVVFAACNKVADLPVYKNGVVPVLTASTTTIAPAPADSNSTSLTLNWTSPAYATDSSNMKYIIEIDSTGRNFSKEVTKTVVGKLTTSFTAKEINTILLGYGFAFNTPYDMDVRVTSSYTNNNERLLSNVIKIKMTPYKVPPKVPLPTTGKLFLVGDASQGGWSNPVPTPSQEFARINETTFSGVFKLNGGKQYLVLPLNGDWGHKYSVADNSISGLASGGDFGFDLSSNFPGPATSGTYVITLDFQIGKFTVVPYVGTLPDNLFMVGDATPGGWSNPVPTPTQQFTRLNSSDFTLTVALNGGKQYLLLPVNGDWGHKYAVNDPSVAGLASGGKFGYDFGQNFPGPAASGTYQINVRFVDNTFTVIKQ